MIHMSLGSIPQQETIIHMSLETPRNLLRLINKTFAVLGVSKARNLSATLEATLQSLCEPMYYTTRQERGAIEPEPITLLRLHRTYIRPLNIGKPF